MTSSAFFKNSTFYKTMNLFDLSTDTLRSQDMRNILKTQQGSWSIANSPSNFRIAGRYRVNDFRVIGLADYLIIPPLIHALKMQFKCWENYLKDYAESDKPGSDVGYIPLILAGIVAFLARYIFEVIEFHMSLTLLIPASLHYIHRALTSSFSHGEKEEGQRVTLYIEAIKNVGRLLNTDTVNAQLREAICTCKNIVELNEALTDKLREEPENKPLSEEQILELINSVKQQNAIQSSGYGC